MAGKRPVTAPQDMVIDKQWLREKFAEMDARTGFVPVPDVTAEQLHAMMLADGVRREDNIFSRGLLRERDPDDYPNSKRDGDAGEEPVVRLIWDASALAKRYAPEIGSDTAYALWATVPMGHMAITFPIYAKSLLRAAVVQSLDFMVLAASTSAVLAGIDPTERHNINHQTRPAWPCACALPLPPAIRVRSWPPTGGYSEQRRLKV